jgi:hypothetical protein
VDGRRRRRSSGSHDQLIISHCELGKLSMKIGPVSPYYVTKAEYV